MNFSLRLLPLLIAASVLPVSQAMFQGCATIVDGPREKINVDTQPKGARVFVNGHLIGTTPISAVVSRWGIHRVRIEMAGYKPLEIPLEKKFNDMAGNNIFLGGVWIVVDAFTGAIFRLDVPERNKAEFLPLGRPPTIYPEYMRTEVRIATGLKPDPALHKIGQLERSF